MARIGELIGPNGEVIHPKTSASVVYLEDGRSVEQILSEDIDYGNIVFQDTSCKISSDIEDDFAKTVVIKGQTYQNILPEPSLHNSMNKGKTMQKLNEGYSNVNVVDGIGKHAILKGQTLVNVANQIHVINYVEQPKADYITLVHTGNENAKSIRLKNNGLLKPNTKYLIMLDVVENTLTTKMQISKNAALCGFNDIEMYPIKAGQTGVVKLIVTSKNEFINVRDYLYLTTLFGQIGDGTQQIKLRIMLLEYQDGMENWDIPYFEGMKSVKNPAMTTIGKNLLWNLDPNHPDDNFSDSGGGTTPVVYSEEEQAFYTRRHRLIKLNLMPDTKYTFSAMSKNRAEGESPYIWLLQSPFVAGFGKRTDNWERISYTFTTNSSGHMLLYIYDSIYFKDIQLEASSIVTPYTPNRTLTLTTPDELELRGVGEVCDTLNLITGEKIECIGEIVLNGSESWEVLDNNTTNTIGFTLCNVLPLKKTGDKYVKVNCDKLPSYKENLWNNDKVGCVTENDINQNRDNTQLQIRVLKSSLREVTTQGFREWLKANPVTVQYILETPIIKTVDLSSFGNWEKLTLDGNERWILHGSIGEYIEFRCSNTISNAHKSCVGFSSEFPFLAGGKCERIAIVNGSTYIVVKNTKANTVKQLKLWLSQNPIEVFYLLSTYQDSAQVKHPIFFEDGHIQLSNGTKCSLIPTLDYQAKTSNSYVMNSMKAGTTYTLKASSASGIATIGNAGPFTLNTNRTIVSPSSALMNNGLFVIGGSVTDLMILEGDLTSKTIPYFKRIKSAFEGEDEIEVLSVGKNLFDFNVAIAHGGTKKEDSFSFSNVSTIDGCRVMVDDLVHLTEGKTYTLSCLVTNKHSANISINSGYGFNGTTWALMGVLGVGETKKVSMTFVANSERYGRRLLLGSTTKTSSYIISQIQIEESSTPTPYEPYKLNTTKIPLSSPLRSLPNGVRDEVILDRGNNKVKVIQRVGEITFNGNERWLLWNNNPADVVGAYIYYNENTMGHKPKAYGYTINNRLPHNVGGHYSTVEGARFTNYFAISIHKNKLGVTNVNDVDTNSHMIQKWFTNNPMTMKYELETPIITEIGLDGYPYIYKDGHIFLNSEIAPVVGLEYSVNQGHRIEGQTETLQRHEQQFTQLERYFADLVYSDYNLTLLRFNKKLHQEEGDV